MSPLSDYSTSIAPKRALVEEDVHAAQIGLAALPGC